MLFIKCVAVAGLGFVAVGAAGIELNDAMEMTNAIRAAGFVAILALIAVLASIPQVRAFAMSGRFMAMILTTIFAHLSAHWLVRFATASRKWGKFAGDLVANIVGIGQGFKMVPGFWRNFQFLMCAFSIYGAIKNLVRWDEFLAAEELRKAEKEDFSFEFNFK